MSRESKIPDEPKANTVAPDTPGPGKEARTWTLIGNPAYAHSPLVEGPDIERYERVPVVEQAAYDEAKQQAAYWKGSAEEWERHYLTMRARHTEALDKLAAETQRADQATKFWEDKTAEWAQQYLDVTAERDRLALRVEELEATNELLHRANAALLEEYEESP